MKIGLIRHFKVNQPFPEKILLSKAEVINWFTGYDTTQDIEYKDVDLSGINWHHCYSSPMIRTMNTASHIYGGNIEEIKEIKELSILHRLPGGLKLPFLLWGLIVRIQSFSSNPDTDKFRNEIIAFVDKVIADNEKDNILIVSHWFVMRVIKQELIKKNFAGDRSRSTEYGKIYVYDSPDS